jgi:hypothetical protein
MDILEKFINSYQEQETNSAATSRNQVPAMLNRDRDFFRQKAGDVNLDIGGGKYDLATEYLAENYQVENLVYDPFNRSGLHNRSVIQRLENQLADSATILNVLNVVYDLDSRISILEFADRYTEVGGNIYISVYIRDGSNREVETRDGIQLNARPSFYLPEIISVFGSAEVLGNPEQKSGTGFILAQV